MDQGISAEAEAVTPAARALRLALLLVGAVSGLLLLSFAVGSSSASADDGDDSAASIGSVVGGVVATVTETVPAAAPATSTVGQVVQAVTHSAPAATVVTPVAEIADEVVVTVLGDEALGTAPVGSLLAPVAEIVDKSLGGAGDVIGPVLETPTGIAASATAAAAQFDAASSAVTSVVVGTARGLLDLAAGAPLLSGDAGSTGLASVGSPLPAAVALGGFLLLLAMRRHTLPSRAMPRSPVFDTDSSPD